MLLKKALLCEWLEPEQVFATAPFYHVNLTHNGKSIWQMWTEARKIEKKIHLNDKEAYIVYIRVLKPKKEEFSETHVNFTSFGMLSLTFPLINVNSNHT